MMMRKRIEANDRFSMCCAARDETVHSRSLFVLPSRIPNLIESVSRVVVVHHRLGPTRKQNALPAPHFPVPFIGMQVNRVAQSREIDLILIIIE